MKQSRVKVCSKDKHVDIRITSEDKPAISEEIMEKWQDIVDMLALSLKVPVGLVMGVDEDSIRVLASSSMGENPYQRGEAVPLLTGLYCETVMGTKSKLIVTNALKDPSWKNNPDIKLNMISYLGLPIEWPDGEILGTICVLDSKENQFGEDAQRLIKLLKSSIEKDLEIINEREKLKKELEEKEEINKKLKESQRVVCEKTEYERVRSEFFSNISHEFRTPLNVLTSAIQLIEWKQLQGSLTNEFISKYMGIMKQNSYRLIRLVNNIIEMTKVDSNYLEMRLQNVDISELVQDITLSVKEYISDKGIKLSFKSQVKNRIIAVDPGKIETIMLNLLSNAVKFTEKGDSIWVKLSSTEDMIIISVRDNGIGIPEDKLGIIFERFRQVDKSFTRNHEGSGIGLSLVKALVERHNGIIDVVSKYGKGTEFKIELPNITMKNDINELIKPIDTIEAENNRIERITIEFSDVYNF